MIKNVWTKPRRGWVLEECMVGCGFPTIAGGLSTGRVNLFNNDARGRGLAIYGVMAISNQYPQILAAGIFNRRPGASAVGQAVPVVATAAAQPGQVLTEWQSGIINDAPQAMFNGTGAPVFAVGETPLWVIYPSWELSVWSQTQDVNIFVSFWWGIYRS